MPFGTAARSARGRTRGIESADKKKALGIAPFPKLDSQVCLPQDPLSMLL